MTTKQPSYFSTFKTWCKNGKSPWQCVQNIAKKNNCTETSVWNKLCKANLAFCKKINGSNCYFPVNYGKSNSKCWNTSAYNSCWWAIECCLQHGWCTPEQIYSWTPSQICWWTGQKMAKCYKKPVGFSPTKSVKGFPKAWTGTTTTTKKTTKKSTKKSTTCKRKKSCKPAKSYKFGAKKYRTRKAA